MRVVLLEFKKVHVAAVCLVSLAGETALAQGQIYFSNRVSGSIDARLNVGCWEVASGPGYTAQLYAGPLGTPEGSLQPVHPTTTFRTGSFAGYFLDHRVVTVPNVGPGERGTFQIRVWYNGGGVFQTWEEAQSRGVSNLVDSGPLGGLVPNGEPPLPPPDLVGLQPFVCPEPSSQGLLAVGGAAVALLLWKGRARNRGVALLIAWIGLAAGGKAWAQGQIYFSNRVSGRIDAKIFGSDFSTPLGGSYYTVQLYGGPLGTPANALQPVFPTTTLRTGLLAGYFVDHRIVTVPNVAPGQRGTFQIRYWDNSGGIFATWEEAPLRAATPLFQSEPLGGLDPNGGPPLLPPDMMGLRTIAICPEPATRSLLQIGACMLGLGLASKRLARR